MPLRLYKNFSPEQAAHHNQSLLQLKRARIQAAEWPRAQRFASKLGRVIAEGEAVIQDGVRVDEDLPLRRARKDQPTVEAELYRFFNAKANVLADVYSAVPDEEMSSIVSSAQRKVANFRVAGDAKLAKLNKEQQEPPTGTLANWEALKQEQNCFKRRTMVIDDHARAPHAWVHDLVELAYKLETAQALIPTEGDPTDGPTPNELDHSISQLRQAQEHAEDHGDLSLVQMCGEVIEQIERERYLRSNSTELTKQKVNTLVEVWSTYPEVNSYSESVKRAIYAAADGLVAIRSCALPSSSDLRATFNKLRDRFSALEDTSSQNSGDPLEEALQVKYETEQLLQDAVKATAHTRARVIDVRRSLAHAQPLGEHFAPPSNRTANRYAL